MQTSIQLRRIPLHLLLALMNVYGLSVAAFLLLRWLVGESWGLIALFNSIAHLLFLPAIILLPLALLLRRRATIGLLTPAILAFVLAYGPFFMPRMAQAASASETLRLLTYNVKALQRNFDPALAIIRDSDVDVVALQELSQDMADTLAAALIDRYPYQALHPQADNPIPGQGLLSRYPIMADDYWRIYQAMQRVVLDVDGREVTIYNAHPVQPISRDGFIRRGEEIDDLLARAAAEPNPVILLGDFNMSDQSADYWRVAEQYVDAYRVSGWGLGFTFPAEVPYFGGGRYAPSIFTLIPPLVRLDYIFHDEAFESLEARVWPDAGGSDHLPVYAVLGLR